jgi:hypothetical protein
MLVKTMKFRTALALLPVILAACANDADSTKTAAPGRTSSAITPILLDGATCPGGSNGPNGSCNPTCAELGYADGIRIDPPPPAGVTTTYNLDATHHVTITSDGTTFSWSSDLGIDIVLAKGSNAANEYIYDPESTGDSGLHPPTNSSGGAAGISHLDFCFDYELAVEKSANAKYKRTSSWTIDKTGSASSLTQATGQTSLVDYAVVVSSTSVDSDFLADGTITVRNPSPHAAIVEAITDDMCGTTPTVVCGDTFPITIPAGGSVTCTYSGALPSATDCTNVATAKTTLASHVKGGTGSALVDFGAPTTVVDGCVAVTDNRAGSLGQTCATKTFNYTLPIAYDTCGEHDYDNTATFTTNTTGTTGSDSWNVHSQIDCVIGCTLTQGYWKTHSLRGPAPYDNAWLLVGPAGSDTLFLNTSLTWYTVFRTAPAGRVWYTLAHQYAAALLNLLNGADPTALGTALAQAEALLTGAAPGASIKGAAAQPFTALAYTLASYNQGQIGPGHCSE